MELLYFILGIFFISNLVPIVDGLSSWFLTWVELKKTNLSEKINLTTINMRQASTSVTKNFLVEFVGSVSLTQKTMTKRNEEL